MNERDPDAIPEAHAQEHRLFAWVWAVPIAAAAIVLWLGVRHFVFRGPEVTISFKSAEGLQARETEVRHRGVTVGSVEQLELSPDLSRVIVHVRMARSAASALNENTQFYVVAPHVSVEGISGLSTLVSGAYIEMSPTRGSRPTREFTGLDAAPVVEPDTPGRRFTLTTDDLGSLTRGSPISFHSVSVGEVESYSIAPDGRVSLTAFIQAPHDRLVHPDTHFWNAGGVDVSVGAQGIRVRANSWQQVISGGIAFETPERSRGTPTSPAGATFRLYDSERAARREPAGEEIVYLADFGSNLRGVDAGTGVELEGMEIGTVRDTRLSYDEQRHTLTTLVTLAIDPDRVQILNMPRAAGESTKQSVQQQIEALVSHGLRAQVMTANFLTGFQIVSLEMVKGAPPARIRRVGDYVQIPTSASGDVSEVLESLRSVLKNLDNATSGPELGHAIRSLDATLTHLDQLTTDVQPDVKALIQSLRDTSTAAQSTLETVRGAVGGSSPTGPDLQQLMQQLTDAARSVRSLADYLERHPEALLRGRRGEKE
jgi:paraquat-inducible protein B